jgi:hypothetical protein
VPSIVIPPRFNGPPGAANGGYLAGLIAGALGDGDVEVTFKAPAPLGRELELERRDGGALLRDGDTVVAEVRPAEVDVVPPEPVSFDVARAAAGRGPFVDEERHPFPHCFVCGPAREDGDGLRIFVGPVDGGRTFAGVWTPPASIAGPDGVVPSELVWAALDCPTSGPVANDPADPGFRPIVLGRFAARVDRDVIPGERHVVLSWTLAVDGRKREAAAALYAVGGELCALSRALWIELRHS